MRYHGLTATKNVNKYFKICFLLKQTTNAILWCLYELALDPDSQARIVEELRRHGNDAGDVTFEGIQQMMYTKAVVKETLRFVCLSFNTLYIPLE